MNSNADNNPILLHNPSCSKSRAAKQWLDGQGVAYELREYIEKPLSAPELIELGSKLGAPLRDWVRDAGAVAEVAQLPEAEQNESLAKFLEAHPEAMQRPILIRGGQARVGRPLEALHDLI